MQIKLFPDEKAPSETAVSLQDGSIGPIRFAATPTSYPHVCRILKALTANGQAPAPETGSPD